MKLQNTMKSILVSGLLITLTGCGGSSSNPVKDYQDLVDSSVPLEEGQVTAAGGPRVVTVANRNDFLPGTTVPQDILSNFAKVVFPSDRLTFRLGEAPRQVTFQAEINETAVTDYRLELVDGHLVGASNLSCTQNRAGLDSCTVVIHPSEDVFNRSENGVVTLQFAFIATFKDGDARDFAVNQRRVSRIVDGKGIVPVTQQITYAPQAATPSNLLWDGLGAEEATIEAVRTVTSRNIALLVTDRSASGTQSAPTFRALSAADLAAAIRTERADVDLCAHLTNTAVQADRSQSGLFRFRFTINGNSLAAAVRAFQGRKATVKLFCAFEIQSAFGERRARKTISVSNVQVPVAQ